MKKENISYRCPKNKKHTLRQNISYTDMKTCDHCKQHWTIKELADFKDQPKELLLRNLADNYDFPFLLVEINANTIERLKKYRTTLKGLPAEFKVEVPIGFISQAFCFELFRLEGDEHKRKRIELNEPTTWKQGFRDIRKEGIVIDWAASEYKNLKTINDCKISISEQELVFYRMGSDFSIKSTLSWVAFLN